MAISVSEIPKEVEMAIEKMPPISPIIGKVNQIAHEIETSPKELVKIIMLDPVLTGKVIKLVNSSFYGVAERVQSLPQAVILLGVNTVKNLAVSTALLGTISIKKKKSPLDLEEFWKHCLASAVGCKLLGKALNVPNEEMGRYFVAGLLYIMELCVSDQTGETGKDLIQYFLKTNPWGIQHGDQNQVTDFDSCKIRITEVREPDGSLT